MLPFLAAAGSFLTSTAGAATISAAATVGSAYLQKKQQDRAFRQDQKNYQRNDLIKTMRDAKEAGFNPLEALRSGYTQSQVAQAPRISSVSVAANAVDQISAIYRDETQRKTNDALIEAQIANINADTARMGNLSQSPVRVASSGAAAATVPSTEFTPYDDQPTIPVLYNGKTVDIFQNSADRLGIKRGDILIAEDIEALGGEVSSVIAEIDQAASELLGSNGGFMTQRNRNQYGEIRPESRPVRLMSPTRTVNQGARVRLGR